MKNTALNRLLYLIYGGYEYTPFENGITLGFLYFFFAIFWANVIHDIIELTIDNEYIKDIICFFGGGFGLLLAVSGLGTYFCPQSIDIALVGLFLMRIGYHAKDIINKIDNLPNKHKTYILLVVLLLWLFLVKDIRIGIDMASRRYSSISLNILGALSGIYLYIVFIKNITFPKLMKKFFIRIGKNTNVFLCFHWLINKILIELGFVKNHKMFFAQAIILIFITYIWDMCKRRLNKLVIKDA